MQSGDSPDPVSPRWCLRVADIDAARAELESAEIAYFEGAQGDVVQIWIGDQWPDRRTAAVALSEETLGLNRVGGRMKGRPLSRPLNQMTIRRAASTSIPWSVGSW